LAPHSPRCSKECCFWIELQVLAQDVDMTWCCVDAPGSDKEFNIIHHESLQFPPRYLPTNDASTIAEALETTLYTLKVVGWHSHPPPPHPHRTPSMTTFLEQASWYSHPRVGVPHEQAPTPPADDSPPAIEGFQWDLGFVRVSANLGRSTRIAAPPHHIGCTLCSRRS
jgi:hypothetical protein